MFLAGDFSFIGFIFSIPFFLNIVIILFLLVGASIGYARGFWRGTFNLIVTIIILLISWFVLLDSLSIFVNTRLFSMLGITFKVGDFETSSLEELIKQLVELGKNDLPEKYANPDYVYYLSLSISKSIAWLIVVILIQLLSWILSAILYFLIMRLIIPEKLRKVKLRLVGALFGLIQTTIIIFAYMISFANISPAMENVGELEWCDSNIQMILEAFNPNNSMLAPYVEGLNSMIDGKFEFEVDSINYKLDDELREFIELISKINNNFKDSNEDDENSKEVNLFISDYISIY